MAYMYMYMCVWVSVSSVCFVHVSVCAKVYAICHIDSRLNNLALAAATRSINNFPFMHST